MIFDTIPGVSITERPKEYLFINPSLNNLANDFRYKFSMFVYKL